MNSYTQRTLRASSSQPFLQILDNFAATDEIQLSLCEVGEAAATLQIGKAPGVCNISVELPKP